MRSWQQHTRLVLTLCTPLLLASGCGESDDPFAESGESGDSATGGEAEAGTTADTTAEGTAGTSAETTAGTSAESTAGTTDTTTDATTGDGDGDGETTTGGGQCAPAPTRFVVLGDSVPAGVGTNGPQGDMNAFKIMHAYIESNYAGGSLTFENYSVGGAQTADIPNNQIGNVPTGQPGHVVVNVHIGGNDLAGYIFDTDANALADFPSLTADALSDWAVVWDFFENPANFPDGVTMVVNTQYNPFDDCDSAHTGVSLSDTKSQLLRDYNVLIRDMVAEHPGAIVADQHGPFLGHGHNYDNPECASYTGGDYWMVGGFDFIHANQAGHAGMSVVFNEVADELYANCE